MLNGRFEKVYWQESPIVNADRWMRWEAIRIFLNTRHAARLADDSIRRGNNTRRQRGRWM